MKNIRIAVCLSGEPRYWERASKTLPTFIQGDVNNECKVDIFYHFWDNITKRQSHIITAPIIEKIDKDILYNSFKPTFGVCENKDCLDPHIETAWEYIEYLKDKHNINNNSLREGQDTKENFFNIVKTTNCPPFSQLISMCKSFEYMLNFSEKNNTFYDIIIRTRSDVEIAPISLNKIKNIINKDKLSRYILFPSISVRTPGNNNPILQNKALPDFRYFTPFVEFCFFIGSSKIITKNVFDNYTKKITELLFHVKNKSSSDKDGITYLSSHNCVPTFLKQDKNTQIGAPIPSFKYSLLQMPKQNG